MATNQMTGRGNLRAAWAPKIAGGIRRLSAALFLGLVLFGCVGATFGEDGETQGPYRKKWVLHTDQVVNSLAFSPDGQMLATGGHSPVHLWDLKEGRLIRKMKTPFWATEIYAFTPDESSLLTAPVGGKPRAPAVAYGFSLVDVATDRVRDIESPYGTRAEAVALSPKGDVAIALYAPWEKGRIAVYDTKSWEIIRQFAPERRIASTIAISPDGIHLAVAKFQGIVQIWNYRTGALIREFKAHTNKINSLDFGENGEILAVTVIKKELKGGIVYKDDNLEYNSKMLSLWDVHRGGLVSTKYDNDPIESWIDKLSFSKSSKFLAIRSRENGIEILDPGTLNSYQELKINYAQVLGMKFSDDERYFAVGGTPRIENVGERIINIWENHRVSGAKSGN